MAFWNVRNVDQSLSRTGAFACKSKRFLTFNKFKRDYRYTSIFV